MTSQWDQHQIEDKVTAILDAVAKSQNEHHFGSPFLSAYQLAIEFARKYPDVFAALNYPVGGAGIGQHTSLAQYLAHELSRRIHAGHITHIEGAFLSGWHVHEITFRDGEQLVHSSLTGPQLNTSLFRVRSSGG